MDMAWRSERTGGRSTLDDREAPATGEVDLDSSGTRRPSRATTFTRSNDQRVRPPPETPSAPPLGGQDMPISQKPGPVRLGTEGAGSGRTLGSTSRHPRSARR